ncbi:alkaline phosphatase [Malassezia nana]|uniref:Alkaline phosphatase n=1 Tax=Malassezia nana TaxID=180528 RepID=A0AAF0J795_9BASI|nr:alkaline phosphatase [Malassezia nana]
MEMPPHKTAAVPDHISQPLQQRSKLLLVVQGVCSIVFRLLAFFFLRVLPGGFGFYAIHVYLGYLAMWILYDLHMSGHSRPVRLSLRAMLLGHSTPSRRFNLLQLVLHTLLLLFVLDLYYGPHMFPSHREASLRFARMGAISPNAATIHVRYPTPLPPLSGLWESGIEGQDVLTDASEINEAPVRVVWRRVVASQDAAPAVAAVRDARRWERGPRLRLTNETDWTATATLENLWPATQYEWRLAFVHNNTFAPLPERPISFVTWPDPRLSAYRKSMFRPSNVTVEESVPFDDPNHFKFASVSCIKPDFPYHPAQFWAWNWLLQAFGIGAGPGGISLRNRVRGFDLMADRLVDRTGRLPGIRFLLELGDLIYADVPRYEGPDIQSYRKLYRNLFASASFQRVYRSIPILGIYDDHEVVNNWTGGGFGSDTPVNETEAEAQVTESSPPLGMVSGLQAWSEYVGAANPKPQTAGEHYYSFRYGDSAFFVMDTRKFRTHPNYDSEERTMLGEVQREALLHWLSDVNYTATFKFLVSSVPFTSLWGGPLDLDGRTDGWSFYKEERQMLLDVIQYVPNVIILSGDRHEFASVSFRDKVIEFSTSPLSMFYIPIRTLAQEHSIDPPGEEVLLKYLPDGHHKWTELEVDTRDPKQPVLKVSVQVDGKEAWKLRVEGQPVQRPQGALGALAQTLMELLGFRKRAWF